MNIELEFVLRVIRNGIILAGLYFISVWSATQTLSFETCKPVLIFLGTYILTEFAARYGLSRDTIKSNCQVKTLVL
jgi:hypothetical protein